MNGKLSGLMAVVAALPLAFALASNGIAQADIVSFDAMPGQAQKMLDIRKLTDQGARISPYSKGEKRKIVSDYCLEVQRNIIDRLEERGIRGFRAAPEDGVVGGYRCEVSRLVGKERRTVASFDHEVILEFFYGPERSENASENLQWRILQSLSEKELKVLVKPKGPALPAPKPRP